MCLRHFCCAIEFEILDKFEELSKRWDKTPPIVEFMPYLKKLLVDNRFQIIGIVAGYDQDVNERTTPFVYHNTLLILM